jgi:predicted transcriptional regulator
MNVAFDLAAEMRRREIGTTELARMAQVSRASVARIRAGRSGGRPATRRALRMALRLFPPVDEAPR